MTTHLNSLNALLRAEAINTRIDYPSGMFEGSDINPLALLRLITLDHARDEAISPEDCASITGLSPTVFETTDTRPDMSGPDLERALGRMALAWLASVRNQLAEDAGLQGRETLTTSATGLLYVRLPQEPVRKPARRMAA